MKKKVVALVMALCLLVTAGVPAFAAEGPVISLEQAMATAREVLELPETAKNVEVNYYEGALEDQGPVWNLGWNIQSGQSYHYMSVGIDAETGEVRHLSAEDDFWRNRDSYKGAPKYSKEDAEKAVTEFLQKYAPTKFKELKLAKINNDYFYLDENTKVLRYAFTYEHRYNGVITDNTLTVNYDPHKGKIFSMWTNWIKPDKYPDPTGVITPEAAKQIFEEKVGLQLMYYRQDVGMPALTKDPKLIYMPGQLNTFGTPTYIDAKTGELFSPYGDFRILDATSTVSDLKPIVEGPIAEIPVLAKELTMEEARAKAEAFIKLGSEFKLTSSRYNETMPSPGQKTWTFDWNNTKGSINYSVAVDISTGSITNFNMWNSEPESNTREPKVTWDEGKTAAINFIKEFMPDKASQLALETQQGPNYITEKAIYYPRHTYSFVRLVNGIPYNGNRVNIDVDNTTGKVVSCWSNWEQRDFKPIGQVVSKAEAMATYLKDAKFELRFVRVERPLTTDAKILPRRDIGFEYKIAYVPTGKLSEAINARTGEPMALWDYSAGENARSVIGKHWAVEQVVAMVQAGIVQGDGKDFKLNDSITRAEFAKLLVKAGDLEVTKPKQSMFDDVSAEAWFYPYVASAGLNGLVTGEGGKFRPNDPVTRQEMVVMLARLIEKEGYKFSSENNDAAFKDAVAVESWAKDKVTKIAKLGLVSGDKDKNFRPLAKSTRAEAINLLYMMLVKIN